MWTLKLFSDVGETEREIATISPNHSSFDGAVLTENATYWWKLSSEYADIFGVSLQINGEFLTKNVTSPTGATFRWETQFHAGFVDVNVVGVRSSAKSFRIIVDPARHKLVRGEYRRMLLDIFADTKSLAMLSGFKFEVGRGHEALPLAKIEFILESMSETQRLVTILDRNYRGNSIELLRQCDLDRRVA